MKSDIREALHKSEVVQAHVGLGFLFCRAYLHNFGCETYASCLHVREEEALRVIPRGKQRLTVYRAHQVEILIRPLDTKKKTNDRGVQRLV